MDSEFIFDGELFKQTKISKKHYVSASGKVFSLRAKGIIRGDVFYSGTKKYLRISIKRKHYFIHRLVFETWVRPLLESEQVNHKDDNSMNNSIDNLYAGTQKDNIRDCFNNGNRIGNIWYLTVLDKETDSVKTFTPASDFISYCGHPCRNQSVKRMFTRNWFKARYEILEYRHISTKLELESVTTMGDECSPVE